MTTFFSRIQNLYETDPERTAVHWMLPRPPGHPMSRRELIGQAAGYAAAFEAAGVQPGEVVILILQHSEALAASFFGAVLRGRDPQHHAVPHRKALAGFLPALAEIVV